jgi:hypothetical protein
MLLRFHEIFLKIWDYYRFNGKKLGKYEKYFATTNKLCKLAISHGVKSELLYSCGFTKYIWNFGTIIDFMAKKLGKYEKYFATTNKLYKLAIAQWGQIRIFIYSCGFTIYFWNFATIIGLMGKKHPLKSGKYENYFKKVMIPFYTSWLDSRNYMYNPPIMKSCNKGRLNLQ